MTPSVISAALHASLIDPLRRRRVVGALALLWLLMLIAVALSEATFLTRTGQWTKFWPEEAIADFAPEGGFAYSAASRHPELSTHLRPSPAGVFENGVQIGMRNAPLPSVSSEGAGRYLFWHDRVIFSTPDNSDPRTNGRRYTISYPPISPEAARRLYAVTGLLVMAGLLFTALLIRSGLLTTMPPATRAWLQRRGASAAVIVSALSLVVTAAVRAIPGLAPLVTDLWMPVLLINFVAAMIVRVRFGQRVPASILAAYLIALVTGYYWLTAWAPQRAQGCQTSVPTPVWDLMCTSGDSASYYFGYAPGSTRQPLYPWFIKALTPDDFVPSQYATSAPPGLPKTDPRDPLMTVVRAQIVLMLAASVLACAALMQWSGSVLPAALFLWMYDRMFFTAVELNIVLTEDLVQAIVFLLAATTFWFAMRPSRWGLLVAGLLAGLVYLTRQASAYCALLLVVISMIGLASNWRRWWLPVAGAFAIFGALVFVPDIYAVIDTGSLTRQQDSLQYQYRIAHAMQYASPADLALMPDQESRDWLAAKLPIRDAEHRSVDAQMPDRYSRMVYYINVNLYSVAMPSGTAQPPAFFMKVATPILKRHFLEYLAFGFEFWRLGLTQPGLGRTGLYGLSPWLTYAVLWALILWLRDRQALVAAALILCHWGGVAIASLMAAPLPRMVWASENLVLFAAFILFWSAGLRLADMAAGRSLAAAIHSLVGRSPSAVMSGSTNL